MKRVFTIAFLACFVLTMGLYSCSSDDDNASETNTEQNEDDDNSGSGGDDNNNGGETEGDDDDNTEDGNSQDVTYDNAVKITFIDGSVTIENDYADNGISIATNGEHVTVNSTISSSTYINYVVTGTTTDGSVKIYSNGSFGLALNGAIITNPTGAAINVQSSQNWDLKLVENTNNTLKDGTDYYTTDGEKMKGTIYSVGSINVEGSGKLTVYGYYKHAISTEADFVMDESSVIVKTAKSDAIHTEGNVIISGGSFTSTSAGEGIDAALDLVINGGKFNVTTTGEKAHGFKTGDGYGMYINDGTYTVSVSGAGSKCFNSGNDFNLYGGTLALTSTAGVLEVDYDITESVAIKVDNNFYMSGGDVTINCSGAGGKGIKNSGTFVIDNGSIDITTSGGQYVNANRSDDTAAKAVRSAGNLTVNNGTIKIKTSGYEAEGLESKTTLTINGGTIEIEAYDDCINAATHIEFNGGMVYCKSTTNDGVDSNGTLTITGGTIVSIGSSSPEEGFDCDNNTFKITGGTVIGFGGSTSSPTTSVTTQYTVGYGANSSYSTVQIAAADGTSVLVFKVPSALSSSLLLFSSPDLTRGTTYSINTGVTISGDEYFHGIYKNATVSGGSTVQTFTPSSTYTTVGSTGGGGGGGGGGGRP